ADLRQASQPADSGCGGKRLEVTVTDFGGQASRPDLVEANIFVEVERKPIRADGAMKSDEHLALLRIPDTLDGPDQPRALRHQELLMVVRIVVGRQHDQDRAAETAVDVGGQ